MIQKHCNLVATSVFCGAPTLFPALHSHSLASGPDTAGRGGGITEKVWHQREWETQEREINMQEEGKRAGLQSRGYVWHFEGGFNGESKK